MGTRVLSSILVCLLCYTGAWGLVFTSTQYQFSAKENSPIGMQVGSPVECTDTGGAPLSNPVMYSLSDPTGFVPLVINSTTGSLSVSGFIDFEVEEQYTFTVECSDVSDPSINATAVVELSVLGFNDNLPLLIDSSITVNVSESIAIGTVLVSTDSTGMVQYIAIDDDSGPDGVLRFLPGDNSPAGFQLDETSGALSTTQELDVDTLSSTMLVYIIVVCDGDRPIEECPSLDVLIFIQPVNDNTPEFDQAVYVVTVLDNTPVDTIIAVVMCTDADRHGAGEFSGITVEPADAPVYIPDPTNGTIVLRESLDFEDSESINVTLVCIDSGGLNDTSVLQIIITPENDNSPVFSASLYIFSVERTAAIGREVGQVIAVDANQDPITYELSGPGSENFLLRPDGTLVLNEFVLVTEGSFFELTVTASDGTFNETTTVRIKISGVYSVPEIIIIIIAVVATVSSVCALCIVCLRQRVQIKTFRRPQSSNEEVTHTAFELTEGGAHNGPLYETLGSEGNSNPTTYDIPTVGEGLQDITYDTIDTMLQERFTDAPNNVSYETAQTPARESFGEAANISYGTAQGTGQELTDMTIETTLQESFGEAPNISYGTAQSTGHEAAGALPESTEDEDYEQMNPADAQDAQQEQTLPQAIGDEQGNVQVHVVDTELPVGPD